MQRERRSADDLAVVRSGYGVDPDWPAGTGNLPLTRRPLHLAHQQPLSVDGTRHDVELRGIAVPVTLRRLPGTQPRQRRVVQVEHRHGQPAQLLPRIRLQTGPVAVPIGQPRVARRFRQDRPVRSYDAEPQSQEWIVNAVETALPRRRIAPERDLAAYESIAASVASGRDRLAAGRPSRPAISLMRCPPAPITSSIGRSAVAGGISDSNRRSGSSCNGPAGSRTKRVDRGSQVISVWPGELPVPRQTAP